LKSDRAKRWLPAIHFFTAVVACSWSTVKPTKNEGKGRFADGGRRTIDGDAQYGHSVERMFDSNTSLAPQDWHEISSGSVVGADKSVAMNLR
jgi:hypothetical protein